MGQSAILESISKGNWTIDNLLTGTYQNDKKINIYNNVIEKYTNDLEKFEEAILKSNFINEWDEKPVFELPVIKKRFDIQNQRKFSKKVQKWKGIVIDILDDHFEAKLFDLTNRSNIYEIGELDIEDISPDDKQLLKEGSIFYWTVGHFMDNGQITKRSELRFQRLITLDDNDMEDIFLSVDKKFSKLKERKIDFK
jgi:hypothetical protein